MPARVLCGLLLQTTLPVSFLPKLSKEPLLKLWQHKILHLLRSEKLITTDIVEKRVYEADPLICPQCGGGMRVIAFIERRQDEVIRKILQHYGRWEESRGPPETAPPVPTGDHPQGVAGWTYEPDPEFCPFLIPECLGKKAACSVSDCLGGRAMSDCFPCSPGASHPRLPRTFAASMSRNRQPTDRFRPSQAPDSPHPIAAPKSKFLSFRPAPSRRSCAIVAAGKPRLSGVRLLFK